MNDFSGQKAVVTGGTRGIGRAIAEALLGAGCQVVITGSREQSGWWDGVDGCQFLAVDFACSGAVRELCAELSGSGANLLVNNAGTFHAAKIDEFGEEEWDRLMAVNLRAPMLLMGALAPGMRTHGGGRIVNIGSIAGFVSRSGLAGYSTTKAGMAGLTRAAALDYAADQTLVNCVCPAYTETDMLAALDDEARAALLAKVPLGRFCQPADVAKAVLFLLSPDNSMITGQTLIIDGGVVLQ